MNIKKLCLIGSLWLVSVAVYAQPKPYLNHELSVGTMEQKTLREIFFVRKTKWEDGTPVRVFVLPDRHQNHIQFTKEVLGVYPYQLRSTWDRMVFSGTGIPPKVVQSEDEMRQLVDATPGGIGYILK